MSLVWAEINKMGSWTPLDSEEHIHPDELDSRRMNDELDHRHVQRLADSIRQHGYSPERHGQLGLNITDHGENVYHHADGSETDPEDIQHHEHLLRALKDVGHGEVPVHIHDQQSDPDGEAAPRYYHGTTAKDLDEIRPNYGSKGNFGNNMGVHEPGYAYATGRGNAEHYADEAADMHGGRTHVYEVAPLGPVEKDPDRGPDGFLRGNFADDVRSKHGFQVVSEEDLGHGEEDEGDDWA